MNRYVILKKKKEDTYDIDELVPIVAWLTEKYTSKESTSVSYSTARQLMGAVIYCIREFEVTEGLETTALNLGGRQMAKDAYEKGYELVIEKVNQTKKMYDTMQQSFQAYGNLNYFDTAVKGIEGFLKCYDARYNPQNNIITMDYPVLMRLDQMCGVDLINRYLNCIRLEQLFLSQLPESFIRSALERYHCDYEDLFINICSIVLHNVLCCMIAEKKMIEMKISEMKFTEKEYAEIKKFALQGTVQELKGRLLKLTEVLVEKGYYNSRELLSYLQADLSDFAVELRNMASNNHFTL